MLTNSQKTIPIDKTLIVSQEHLDIALNQVRLGFWELDLDGMTLNCTPQCKMNFGMGDRPSLSYEELLACIVPEDRQMMQTDVAKALVPGNGIYHSQYRARHPDGSLHWIEANGTVLFRDNTPYRMIGTTLDITEKKDLELLKDELLNVATHELKTPVSAVKGYLQILHRFIETTHNEKFINISNRALGSTERITRLLTEIADPAHRHLNQIRLSREHFDLRTLIDEIAGNAMLINPEYTIEIFCTGKSFMVLADRFRIGQVLTNLVNNAIKYSPDHKHVDIRLSTEDSWNKVQVIDSGIGINKDEHAKVFQKFYRTGSGSKIAGGFGIGLYLSSEIITRHGGQIGIEEKKQGAGTEFYFTLPN
ncbi:PAS domain-containing sensor histidine kinase [Mucilaginibacter sp. UR6-1]|uniref:PAS domain-containing sensor histidine kinase n=1 Tax=Mucilaginibacter sp. UR6-1 TaxID=1435643 RepID=UPI001E65A016|nr:PAS domain-containing sensor histidine kinase [Mucilaginibacter sp. UR6-1]MCC8409128.1 PAS domain-containing sensor histidine kinase [Mucilaginibacter sp. UR6-1]